MTEAAVDGCCLRHSRSGAVALRPAGRSAAQSRRVQLQPRAAPGETLQKQEKAVLGRVSSEYRAVFLLRRVSDPNLHSRLPRKRCTDDSRSVKALAASCPQAVLPSGPTRRTARGPPRFNAATSRCRCGAAADGSSRASGAGRARSWGGSRRCRRFRGPAGHGGSRSGAQGGAGSRGG